MTLMDRRRIGTTALEVSIMALGGAPLGGLYSASSQADAQATVDAALRHGISHVDVAPQYGQGLAERRAGASLARHAGKGVTLSTKVGRLLVPASTPAPAAANWPEALPFDTVYDASPGGIRRSLDESIARLGGVRPDVLLLHDPDRYAQGPALQEMIARAYDTLSVLREEGAVQAIGIGVNGPEPCRMALDCGRWDCFLLAGTHSVIRQDDEGLLDRCQEAGVSVMIGGPYMSGALAGGSTWRYRPIPPDIARDIARLRDLCDRHGVPVQAAALQFPLAHPAVASIVVGMRSAQEVDQNVAFLRHPIPSAFWRDIAAAGLIRAAAGLPGKA